MDKVGANGARGSQSGHVLGEALSVRRYDPKLAKLNLLQNSGPKVERSKVLAEYRVRLIRGGNVASIKGSDMNKNLCQSIGLALLGGSTGSRRLKIFQGRVSWVHREP
jgi:hypothetical protein